MLHAVEIIRKKRDAAELTPEEIHFLIRGATAGSIADYQLAAFLMAVVWRGMTAAELTALTDAMLHSGQMLDLSALRGSKVDKHSTGGVGDKASLVIAPVVAAAGLDVPLGRKRVFVPMISGRGLGHTGGTLDKLESIPGFNVNLSLAAFRSILEKAGCALMGQTPEIAPADKKLYALRDVTATVESPYLICASIMSKKLAEGIGALVLDVKTGDGAFMKKQDEAEYLAELMVDAGNRMGKKVIALITGMDQPLGRKVGNALEVDECLDILHGGGPPDLRELCGELAAWMFVLGDRAANLDEGRALAAEMIASGRARDTFREIIRMQGGDPEIVDDPGRLPRAKNLAKVKSPRAGFVASIRCEQIGIASMVLGGGREKKEDAIDPAVGLVIERKVGESVDAGSTLCTVHYNSSARLSNAMDLLANSFTVADTPPEPEPLPLIRKVIGA